MIEIFALLFVILAVAEFVVRVTQAIVKGNKIINCRRSSPARVEK